MTTRQRNLLLALGSLVAVLALVLVFAAPDDGGGDETATTTSSSSSTTTSSTTSTTVELVPVTNPTTSTTGAPGPATTTTTLSPALTASSPVLRPPTSPSTRRRSGGCASLADGPEWETECGTVDAAGVRMVWLVERRAVDGALRAYVFRRLDGDDYAVALVMRDDGPAGAETYDDVNVAVADVSGRGDPEIVFGFRLQGSGGILAVDLVETPGRVAFDLELEKGRARVSSGQLDTWAAQFAPGDTNAAPSSYRHQVIGFRASAWRVVISEDVDPAAVPESQL